MTTYANDKQLVPAPPANPGALAHARQSWLLEMLPAVFAGDSMLERFLFIFEDTLKPIMQQVENFHYYFNPLTAPIELLSWLSGWVNLALDDNWSEEQRRKLVLNASEIYSRRGTRRGLAEFLQLYTGVLPDISEFTDGMTLNSESRLGINTTIAGRERHSFTVNIALPGLTEEEASYRETTIRRIIEEEKPGHTAYRLRILDEKGKQINIFKPAEPPPAPDNLMDEI